MTTISGSLATVLIMIGGLLYMVGAKRLAGRLILIAVALVLAVPFLRCLWANVSVSIPAIDPVPIAAIGSLLLLGLVGAGLAYLRMKTARRRPRTADQIRPTAPEPVPAVRNLGEERHTFRDTQPDHKEGHP